MIKLVLHSGSKKQSTFAKIFVVASEPNKTDIIKFKLNFFTLKVHLYEILDLCFFHGKYLPGLLIHILNCFE
jgi:hypothetical protein